MVLSMLKNCKLGSLTIKNLKDKLYEETSIKLLAYGRWTFVLCSKFKSYW
jgi:hypothetical protein